MKRLPDLFWPALLMAMLVLHFRPFIGLGLLLFVILYEGFDIVISIWRLSK